MTQPMIFGAYATLKSIHTLSDAKKMVENCQLLNINHIILLTKNESELFYPSIIGDSYSKSSFDPYEAVTSEAKRAGIGVSAWFMLYKESIANPSRIVREHPEVLLVNRRGKNNVEEPTWNTISPILWVCPSSLLYREYLINLMEEVMDRYNLDGINLDFVRYPEELDARQYCYCESCRKRFESIYGETIPSDSVVRMRYHTALMCENVTDSVQEIAKRIQAKGGKISAYCFTDYTSAIESVKQDWPSWAEFVDELYLSTYELSPQWAGTIMQRARKVVGERSRLIPVVWSLQEISRASQGGSRWSRERGPVYMKSIIDRSFENGADGAVFYLYDSIFGVESHDYKREHALPKDSWKQLRSALVG